MRLALLLCLALRCVPAAAQDAPPKKWRDTAELSIVSTNGNSRTTTTSAKDLFTYDWASTKLELEGGGLGAKSKGQVTDERYNASEKVSQKVSEFNYVFERFGWDKNRFIGVANRYDTGLGVGREVIVSPRHDLRAELGGGYINEERTRGAKRVSFGSGRAYSKYEFTISPTAKASQDGEYLHNFAFADDYRIRTETALQASINAYFSIKVSYLWTRVGKPPPGFIRDDTTTAVALIASF
ncbi:MAG: DUF481 domain-containing protein [Elusimicrobia bacterium]|nr:DUF481 domain-containing protein [Elusimicrobiota bacterium]